MANKTMRRKPETVPGGLERREGSRVPQPRQVAVYPCHAEGLGRPIRASLTDASPTSIGLTCLGRIAVGTQFVMRLDRGAGGAALQVYRVVRSRDAGGATLVGAQYDHDFTGACPLPPAGQTVPRPTVTAPQTC